MTCVKINKQTYIISYTIWGIYLICLELQKIGPQTGYLHINNPDSGLQHFRIMGTDTVLNILWLCNPINVIFFTRPAGRERGPRVIIMASTHRRKVAPSRETAATFRLEAALIPPIGKSSHLRFEI